MRSSSHILRAAGLGIALMMAGCHNAPDAPTESVGSPTASLPGVAPGANASGPAPAAPATAADLQRIQNDPHLTPQQKAEAIRQFTQRH